MQPSTRELYGRLQAPGLDTTGWWSSAMTVSGREVTGIQKDNLATKNPVRLAGTLQGFCSNTTQWQPVFMATEIPFCWQGTCHWPCTWHHSNCLSDTWRFSQTPEPNLHIPSSLNTHLQGPWCQRTKQDPTKSVFSLRQAEKPRSSPISMQAQHTVTTHVWLHAPILLGT